MNNLFNSFLYCLQPAIRSKIQVYSLDDDHDLDDTIFEAIIQGKLNSFFQLISIIYRSSKTTEKFRWRSRK
jgi:hypothetical protein